MCFLLLDFGVSLGAELTLGASLLGFDINAPGVSDAPGVPGVRTVAAAEGVTGAAPSGLSAPCTAIWAQVVTESIAASGKASSASVRLFMVLTVPDKQLWG